MEQHGQMSRRSFLRGSGVGAATTVLLDTLPLGAAQAAEDDTVGPGAVPIALNVNGVPCALSVAPSTTLAEALRDALELTGTKIGDIINFFNRTQKISLDLKTAQNYFNNQINNIGKGKK